MDMSFGSFIRCKRLEKGYTLRKFCEAVEISPTFISRMERDEIDPPSEEKIKTMAAILSIDPEQLIFMAGRLPQKIRDMVIKRPSLVRLLRIADSKSEHELKKMIEDALK